MHDQRFEILSVAVASDLNLVAVAGCASSGGECVVDVLGLERVHDNELPYKFSFGRGPSYAVDTTFAFEAKYCDVAFSGTSAGILYVADYGSRTVHVLDVLHRTYVESIICHRQPRFVACARDMMAVILWADRMCISTPDDTVEIRQCSRGYPVLRTIHFGRTIKGLCFSPDGATLAVAGSGLLQVVDPSTATLLKSFKSMTEKVAYLDSEGWVKAEAHGIERLDGQTLVPWLSWPEFALILGFGMLTTVGPWPPYRCLCLVQCPDVAAMRAMSEPRLEWMAAVARVVRANRQRVRTLQRVPETPRPRAQSGCTIL